MNINNDNPCFDKKTRTSCPDRCVGCASSCKRWEAYVTERDAQYKQNMEGKETDAYMIERHQKVRKALKKHGIRR